MQITIDIPDQIVAVAAQRGQTPEGYATQVLREDIRVQSERIDTLPPDERQKRIERFLRDFPIAGLPELPESSYRRETMYGDND